VSDAGTGIWAIAVAVWVVLAAVHVGRRLLRDKRITEISNDIAARERKIRALQGRIADSDRQIARLTARAAAVTNRTFSLQDYTLGVMARNGVKGTELIKAEARLHPYCPHEFWEAAQGVFPGFLPGDRQPLWDVDTSLRLLGDGWWMEWSRFSHVEGWTFRRDPLRESTVDDRPPLAETIREFSDD
jgi:uncharacterized coiled-coil protein SlyX